MSDLSKFLSGDSGNGAKTNGSDADDGENGTFAPNETTDLYYTVGDLRATVGKAVEQAYGSDALTSSPDDDAPVMVRWWAAVHTVKNALGKRQKDENGFSLSDTDDAGNSYLDTFGGTYPTVDTATLDSGEKQALKDAGVDVGSLGATGTVHIPAPTGHARLPVHVGSEEALEEAIEGLEALPDEPSTHEGGSTDEDAGGSGDDDECPHCGETFDPRGYTQHVKACEGDTDEEDSDDSEADDGESDERAAYVTSLVKAGASPEEAEAAAAARFDG